MKRFSLILIAALLPLHALAQSGSSSSTPLPDACRMSVESVLSKEHRLYRRALYGLSPAAEESPGAVHYDVEGNAWIKTDAGRWNTQAKGFEGTTWSDALMDKQVERDPLAPDDKATFRRGIFSTRGVLTSELVPPLTQSFRALQCRILSVCEAMKRSMTGEKPKDGIFAIAIAGCRELPVPALTACKLPDTVADAATQASMFASCDSIAESLLSRESELLTLSVTYDAGYRSLLQFAGTFDDFLSVFRLDLLQPIRQSLPLLQQLSRIPCFIAQCNG
jgi:hypothetical protein